jgi:hypothetical protein
MLGTFFILEGQVVHTYIPRNFVLHNTYFFDDPNFFLFFICPITSDEVLLGKLILPSLYKKIRKLSYRELLISKISIAEKCLKTAFFCIFVYESKLGRESLENDPHRE